MANLFSFVFFSNTPRHTYTFDQENQNAGTDCTVNVLDGNKKFWGNNYAYDDWGNLINKPSAACAGENLSVTADAHNISMPQL